MRKFLFAGTMSMALMLIPAAVHAQAAADSASTASSSMPTTFAMSADHQAQYDSWPTDVRGKYDAWPTADQQYFWTLDAEQMNGWQVLSATQRTQIITMAPEQRASAWAQITAQMAGKPAASAEPSAPTGAVAAAPMQSAIQTPDPAQASMSDGLKKYPICTKTLRDNCRNRSGV